jgi:hypothetical protein
VDYLVALRQNINLQDIQAIQNWLVGGIQDTGILSFLDPQYVHLQRQFFCQTYTIPTNQKKLLNVNITAVNQGRKINSTRLINLCPTGRKEVST